MATQRRTKKAYSVALVVSIGSIAVLSSMAVLASMLTGERFSSRQLQEEQCLHNAEIVLNYAISKLSQSAADNTVTSIPKNINLPATLAAIAEKPQQEAIPIQMNSSAFLQSILNYSALPYQSNKSRTEYRMITSSCIKTQTRRQIRAIIESTTTSYITDEKIRQVQSPKETEPIKLFYRGLQANGKLELTNVNLLAKGQSRDQYLGTNLSLKIRSTSQTTIPGSVTVFANSEKPIVDAPNTEIHGDFSWNNKGGAESNPQFTPVSDDPLSPFYSPSKTPNVIGPDGKIGGNTTEDLGKVSDNLSDALNSYQSPTLSANSAASISLDGTTSTIKIDDLNAYHDSQGNINWQNTVASVGQIEAGNSQVNGPSSVSISSGTYVTSGIQISETGQLNLTPSGNFNSVTLNIQQPLNSAGQLQEAPAFEFNGKLTSVSSNPQDFQIYYNGSNPINISLKNMAAGSTFPMLIYAPNANVNIDLAGHRFDGAIVANNLTVSSTSNGQPGEFYYSPNFTNVNPNESRRTIPAILGFKSPSQVPVKSYKIISWQESAQF